MDNSFLIYDSIPINEELLYDLELYGDNSFVWELGSADHELNSQSVPFSYIENAENIPLESNKENQEASQDCIKKQVEEKEVSKTTTEEAEEPRPPSPEKKKDSIECFQCGKRFTQRYSCSRHIREQHQNPQSFRCSKCGLRFSKKFNLQTHEKRVHPNDGTKSGFKCPHCPCIFANKSAEQKHEKIYHAKPQFQASCDFQDDNPQRDAANVVKQLMLLQKDLEDVNFHQQKPTTDLSTTLLGSLAETTTIDESLVNEITITDRLYPFGECKELKVQQVRRNDGKYYLVCEFCSKEFEKSYSYLRHRRIHCGIRPYICVVCKKSFPTQNQLKRHCTAYTIRNGNCICKGRYKCPKCLEIISTISLFDSHLSSHSPSTKITFKCESCQKLFHTFKSFIYHKHEQNDPELNMLKSVLPSPICLIDGKEVVGIGNSAVDKNFTCYLCGLIISSHASLKRHAKCHRNVDKFQCHICNGFFSSQSLQEHRKMHLKVKNFKCKKCPKAFRNNYQLHRHTLKHSNIKNYKCRYCENIFKTSQYCRSHMLTHLKRLIHTNDGEQKLKENPISLQTIIENDDKTAIEIRDMQYFRNKSNSKQFTENEVKSPNFKCMKCPLQFRYRAWLKKHMTQTHSDERPFKCEICFKSFRTNQVLKSHLSTHEYVGTKETCLVCGKKYSSKKSLNIHLRLHTGKKPFNCDVCQKPFRTSGHLIQHRKSNHK